MGFADLQKQAGNALKKLQQTVAESKSGGNKDPRVWKIPYDSNCVGSALIRFLPWGDGHRAAWVEWAEFSFKGKGGNYWNRSLRDLGQEDPVVDLNQTHWNLAAESGEKGSDGKFKGPETDKVKGRNDRSHYIANIFVLEDNMRPDNIGQNKLFKYGFSIHKKIQEALSPLYEDQKPVQVFDLWNGANFRIRVKGKQVGRNVLPNYDDSLFESPSPLHTDMGILENIYNKMFDLTEFENASNYKSYEELEKEMIKTLGQAEVSRIRGESFNAASAAAAGANPFEQGGTAGARSVAGNAQPSDPFSNAQPAAESDPFARAAGGQQQQQQPNDPFAAAGNAGNNGNASADPFAAAGNANANASTSTSADPFAMSGNTNNAGNTVSASADPFDNASASADPFATAGNTNNVGNTGNASADPFAAAGNATTNQQQQNDPFANLDV